MAEAPINLQEAVYDFHRARRRAGLQALVARLRGQRSELLPYEEVRRKLKATSGIERGFQDIPLDAIVGSVGRYTDFTRSFLPKNKSDAYRWAKVKLATLDMTGVPPIDVYKIGEVYFVRDGNHRVSVARELGATHIQAHVTEIHTDVPITPDLQPDDLILKAEHADFARWADLRTTLPDVALRSDALSLTSPGKYQDLKEHINVHRYYMGHELGREVPRAEAVRHWYETVYRPVVDTINRLGLLRDFPDRTETDLYLWVAEHRSAVEEELGWGIDAAAAAADLVSEYSPKPDRVLARVGERIATAFVPDLPSPPTPGTWRERRRTADGPTCERLFGRILVSLDGTKTGWLALDQALVLAKMEGGRVLGLHILADGADQDSDRVTELKRTFAERCEGAHVPGELAVTTGTIAHEITSRAVWVDLIVAPLNHPPGSKPLEKLRSGLRTILVHAPCPVLTVPAPAFPVNHAVLAYDGSPKAREALFVAAYLGCHWPHLSLMTISVDPDPGVVAERLREAEDALARYGIRTETLPVASELSSFEVASLVLEAAKTHDSSLIVVGGYGHTPALEVLLGSTVNEILRGARRGTAAARATLICR